MIDLAPGGSRRAVLRRQLDAIVAGRSSRLDFDLHAITFDPALVVRDVALRMDGESAELRRLVAAFHQSGSLRRAIDVLGWPNPEQRIRGCRTVGALRVEEALPWLTPLLRARDVRVSAAAARALARIGGVRSAEALLSAIERSGPRRVLILALAQAAPDMFLETALRRGSRRATTAVAVAAGLRRRRTSLEPLASLAGSGTRRERVVSCRALGWSRSRSALPSLVQALTDADARVRVSAIKGLGVLQSASPPDQFEILLQIEPFLHDPDQRVCVAARHAVRRLRKILMKHAGLWQWR